MLKIRKILFTLSIILVLTSTFEINDAFAAAPNAPTSLSANTISTSEIDLSWTASTVNGITATGGTITTSGGRTIHTFTSSGTYTISSGSGNVQALVVAGGGGGANGINANGFGGGGAGGMKYDAAHSVSTGSYIITVGAGGNGGSSGGNSVFDTITSTGGGAGGSGAGGSGGGGNGGGGAAGGTGTSGQGNNGGSGSSGGASAGGGGGAGSVGSNGSGAAGAAGGTGTANSNSGSSVTYAGGGGGGGGPGGSGGSGGGGHGGSFSPANGSPGTANTGGGGGGAIGTSTTGGQGGSGIVIISEVTPDPAVTGYKIERSPDGSTWSTIVSNTGTTSTTYADTGLSSATQYYYRVSGINSDGTSSASNVATSATNPNAPTSLTVSSETSSQINLSWTAPSGTVRGYKIERESPVGGGFSTITANTTSTSTTYGDSGLSSGTQYNYRITALGILGKSSAVSSTHFQYTALNAPTILHTTSETSSQIVLGWTAPSGTVRGYKIERESPVGGGFSTITANTTTTSVSYTDNSLSVGTQYNYRITTLGINGTASVVSSTHFQYTALNAPTALKINTISKSEIDPSWTAPSGTVRGYKVESESPVGGGFSTLISNSTTTATTFANTLLTSGTQYNYRIYTLGINGTISVVSPSKSNYTTNVAPTSLVFSMITSNSIRSSWTNPSGNFSGFKIEKESPVGGGFSTVATNTGNSTNRYDLTALASNTIYNVRVSTNYAFGTNSSGTSSPSSANSTTTVSGPPTNISGVVTSSTITLSWSGPSGNGIITGYGIERSVDGVTFSVITANTGSSATTYSDTGLPQNTLYYYKIYAINISGNGQLSPSSSFTTSGTSNAVTSSGGGGGSGIGGPLTPLQITPVLPAISQGITLTASNDVIIPNQIKNETITVTWPTNATLNVNSIQFGASSLETKLVNMPPYGLQGSAYGQSQAIIDYTLQVPQACDSQTTVNCINMSNNSIILPISFDVSINGTEVTQTVSPQFTVQQITQLPLPLIVIGVSFIAASYLILRYKLHRSKLDPRKHFKTEKIKGQRLDKPKKKR